MFGMLDYRAHKLYLIIFGIPWFLLRWFVILGFPLIYYWIGHTFSDNRIYQILISLACFVITEFIWGFVIVGLDKLSMFIFYLLVDVIPDGGRTKEEALAVVKGGHQAIRALNLSKKHPNELTDDDFMAYKNSVFTIFFRDKIDQRICLLKKYYLDHPDASFDEFFVANLLKKNSLEITWVERAVCTPLLRGAVISYALFVYLLLFNPF